MISVGLLIAVLVFIAIGGFVEWRQRVAFCKSLPAKIAYIEEQMELTGDGQHKDALDDWLYRMKRELKECE